VGIVASLRPEKNHSLFLRVAAEVHRWNSETRFLVVGDGPERASLEQLSASLQLARAVYFLGTRHDVRQVLSAMDVFALTSLNEANPVSILEAMACRRPVIAPNVGSIGESVRTGQTGLLLPDHEVLTGVESWKAVLRDTHWAEALGWAGRSHVEQSASLSGMVRGYEELIAGIYDTKRGAGESKRCRLPPMSMDSVPAGEVSAGPAV
jgi:glycosyltransferase involved in cell wall biosynthesis